MIFPPCRWAQTFYSLMCAEQQPRVRGWLLASVDSQTTGLVPANYVKVLGKRRGRKHAEMERLAQIQQANTDASQTASSSHPHPNPTQGFTPGPGSASTLPSSEELLESVYREAPAASSVSACTMLNINETIDLWGLCICTYRYMQVCVGS